MVKILYNADYQFIADEIKIIQNILSSAPLNTTALMQEVTNIPNTLNSSVYHYYIRVFDSQGNIISETPGMREIIPKSNIFSNRKNRWWHTDAGKDYLLMQSSVNLGEEKAAWISQIALDVSFQKSVIKEYRKKGLVVLFLGALLSVVIGYLISRRGLSRLYELTHFTQKITAEALQQRINPCFWPKELNELATAYNQMLNRIADSISRLTAFSDDLAHELRIPITNLMGEMELALTQNYSVEDYQGLMASNLEELNRLYQIIENLLFLARAENLEHHLQKEELDLAREINIMCCYYQAIADEKSIQLSQEGTATASVNSAMFRRMIGNILSNALKYSPNNSRVHFTIVELANQTIQITLTDTGTGIAAKDLPNIFNRFYRAETTRIQPGNGLGLTLVKSVVDLHHGSIKINSVINQGTVITINLPK